MGVAHIYTATAVLTTRGMLDEKKCPMPAAALFRHARTSRRPFYNVVLGAVLFIYSKLRSSSNYSARVPFPPKAHYYMQRVYQNYYTLSDNRFTNRIIVPAAVSTYLHIPTYIFSNFKNLSTDRNDQGKNYLPVYGDNI